jgi:murein DD-endopeptidase MepM/ murein hydrolase activator NlpD
MKILFVALMMFPALAFASVGDDINALLDRFFGGDQTPTEATVEPVTPIVPPDITASEPRNVTPSVSTNTVEIQREIMQQEAELEAFEADLRSQENLSASLKSERLTSQQQLQLLDEQLALNRRKLDFYESQIGDWQDLVENLTREKSSLRAQIRILEREYASVLSKKFIQKQNFQLNPTVSWWQWMFSDKSVSELLAERSQSSVSQINQAEAIENLDSLQQAFDAQELEAVEALSKVSLLESQLIKDQLVLKDLATGKATLLAQLNDDETDAAAKLAQYQQAQAETTQYLQGLRYELTQATTLPEVQEEPLELPVTVLDWPLEAPIIVNAGFKDPEYEISFGREHLGVDFAANQGTDVLAAAEGVVNKIETDSSGYTYLILQHDTDLVTVYGHLSNTLVKEGDTVFAGQLVAWSGGTPGTPGAGFFTSGPHLHFEVFSGGQFVDPLDMLPALN